VLSILRAPLSHSCWLICHQCALFAMWLLSSTDCPAAGAGCHQAKSTKGNHAMACRTVEIDSRLIAFMLPAIPESVPMARFHVRAALGFHELDEYAADAEIITSELVTNVIRHVCSDGSETVGVILARTWNPESVTVVVSDSSSQGPISRDTPVGSEQGRGLQIVEALSAHWGWHPEDGGKAIFAILARKA
jgi:anti-sigma regulatory factor (Ser/Thr protein kinase)